MKTAIGDLSLTSGDGALCLGVGEGKVLSRHALAIDRQLDGLLQRAITYSRFTGARGDYLEILAPAGLERSRIVLFGLGDTAAITPLDMEACGGELYRHLALSGERKLRIVCDPPVQDRTMLAEFAARIAFGLRLASWRCDTWMTRTRPGQQPGLEEALVMVSSPATARKRWQALQKTGEAVFLARELVTAPPNVLYPESFAEEIRKLEGAGIRVELLDRAAMEKLGMEALLGVARGSARPPVMAIMHHAGADGSQPPVALVGKGVCFDSGGLSLKTASGMEDMKWDMAGAAAVVGAMKALAARQSRASVVGVVALVENMPDGNAQRPGDIVRSFSGQTIEVLNTDAEGRLILADALSYVQKQFSPRAVIDLATLTGAIIIALGHEYAGLFSNDDQLAGQLVQAGAHEGEKLWRLPLAEEYDRMLKSRIADMQNIPTERGVAGSITAAQFLGRFIGEGVPWAHIDIAGVAWKKKDLPTVPAGASGYGVRLLNRLVQDNFEPR